MSKFNSRKKNVTKKRATNGGASTNDYKTRTAQTDRIESDQRVGRNDFSWYNRYPELISGAANIDYSLAQGTEIKALDQYIPGFVKYTVATPLPVSDASDPVNVSGTNTYIYINKGKSNNRPYDPVDLTRLLVATADIFAYINWMQRVYGLATLYSTQNRYLPRHLVESMGVDFNNIIRNMANFRAGINQFIRKVGALVLPSAESVPFFYRRAFLYQNVYIESDTIKDQIYFMDPLFFYKYDPIVAGLSVKQVAFTKAKYTDLLDFADALIDQFFGDTDVATMCADIYNAYGDNCIRLSLLPEDYSLVPIENYEVLEQLENADIYPVEPTSCAVECSGTAGENPFLTCKPTAIIDFDHKDLKSIYDKICETPIFTRAKFGSPEITVINSRLKARPSEVTAAGTDGKKFECFFDSSSFGTEIVSNVHIYRMAAKDSIESTYFDTNMLYVPATGLSSNTVSELFKSLTNLSACKYAPHIHPVSAVGDVVVHTGVLGPLSNYAQLPTPTLRSINTACQYSLFALPMSVVK